MNPNLVILAGGISQRMRKSLAHAHGIDKTLLEEVTNRTKSMIGVGEGGRPFLDYLLFNARESGYQDILIVIGEGDRSIRDYYGLKDRGNEFKGLEISYVIQPIPHGKTKPLGTADALLRALNLRTDWRGQKFTVCNSDNLYSQRALSLLLNTRHDNALIDYDRSSLEFDEKRIQGFAVTQKDQNGFLKNIIEKPSEEEIKKAKDESGRIGISMNIFRFSYEKVIPFLESVPLHPVRQEKELSEAVRLMVLKHPKSMLTIELSEHVPDLTSVQDISKVQEFLRKTYANFRF